MAVNDSGKNLMLDELATQCGYMSLHSGSPATAINEISGGSYARKAVTYNSASGGSVSISNAPVFDVPAGETVACVGFCTALTDGTIHADDTVTSESFANAGTYTVNNATITINDAV